MRFQEIQEACWKGYRQAGMKKKGDRQVPNCVPVEEVKTGPEITANQLLYKAAAMAMRDAGREGITLDYEDAIKQASKIYGIPYKPSQLPQLRAQLADLDRRLAPLIAQQKLSREKKKQAKYGTAPAAPDVTGNIAPTIDRIKPATKSLEEAMDPFLDNAARELLGLVIIAGGAFAVGTYYTILNKLKKYQGSQIIDALEHKGVTMNRTTYEQVKPLLNQFRQALKDDEGEQAKMLAKRIEQMIVMGKLSAPEPQVPADTALAAKEKELEEDLKKWFKEKWVRFGPDGKIRGDCARGSNKEGKPKCLPQSKAHALGKKGRASAAAKKRREDPNPERRGAAKNVATRVKEDDLDEACWKGYHKEGNKKMFGKTYPNCVKNTKEDIDEAGRIARKAGQPANSKKHSDLYTDENPRGTITGLKFATVEDARASVSKIRSSGRSHAHKVQAAVAMEQRARAAGKASAAAVYRTYIDSVKKTDESLETYVDQGVCPVCHGNMVAEDQITEKQDACYHKVKSRYKVWPSAYTSGALVQCRKKGAANWGNKSKK
jgi:hypothetical protein